MTLAAQTEQTAPCFGYCRDCDATHSLPAGDAQSHARLLMREFEEIGRLDYRVRREDADPRLGFDQLFAGERGHMFGVLECRNEKGETVILRAFSSLHGGIRFVDGWVSPVLSEESFYGVVLPGIDEIKEMTTEHDALPPGSAAARELAARRMRRSQDLWRRMEDMYCFYNFRGESRCLKDAFALPPPKQRKIPGGIGECCAPKLLNHAAKNGLKPVGLAEFYWGGSNKSGGRQPGDFYSCCELRCQPILGFMLCGLDDRH